MGFWRYRLWRVADRVAGRLARAYLISPDARDWVADDLFLRALAPTIRRGLWPCGFEPVQLTSRSAARAGGTG